jgi:hypothetical protein
MNVKKVAILLDDFSLGSPGQQLADRFLIGFQRDGVFEKPFNDVIIWSKAEDKIAEQRRRDVASNFAKSRDEAIAAAEAILCVQNESVGDIIDKARSGTPLFVYGVIAESVVRRAAQKSIPICAGTVFSTLQQLPPMDIPTTTGIGAQIREALLVTQGPSLTAELNAFDAIAPILDRHGGIGDIRKVRTLEGDAVWEAGNREWSLRMLAAALSRTDKAQGNTLLDGRTEDILGLRLTEKMAKNPRARIIEHSGGVRTTILILDGVVGDLLVAVRAGRRLLPGTIYSTQLFQSPTPQQEQFSRLASVITDFFQTSRPPWSAQIATIVADFAERLRK